MFSEDHAVWQDNSGGQQIQPHQLDEFKAKYKQLQDNSQANANVAVHYRKPSMFEPRPPKVSAPTSPGDAPLPTDGNQCF